MKMKQIGILASLASVLAACGPSSARAWPTATSSRGREYLVNASSLDRWSFGVTREEFERAVTYRDVEYRMQIRQHSVYVGYDILRWATVYGMLNNGQTRIGRLYTPEHKTDYSAGVRFNLLHHDLMEPDLLYENIFRINAEIRYSNRKTEQWSRTIQWDEWFAALTVGLVNEIEGNKEFWPHAIGIFAGPLYSDIHGSDLDEKKSMGFTAGLEFFWTKRLSFDIGLQHFGYDSYLAGAHLRF